MWRKLRSCTTLTLTGYHPLRTARPPTYAPTAVPATQPLQHYASGRATAHTGLALCTILSRPQAPTHGKIGAHRLHFEPKACRSTASEPAGLSVRGGAAQQVTRLFATTRFYAFRLRRSRHCRPDAQKPLRYAFNATFARTPISPCIAITSAKAERAVAHTHTISAKRHCDAHGERSPHNGGEGGEQHGGGIFRDARQQGKGRFSAGRWGVFTDSS